MIKICSHSLFNITFFVIRLLILDGAASPAYAKTQMHHSVSSEYVWSKICPYTHLAQPEK